jgi:hypothetical protein
VCIDGNRPAQSKHGLLETWPAPELVHDVAKFIGFAQFYSQFIHHFKLRIAPLRELTKHKYTNPVALLWTEAAQKAFGDIKLAIIFDPCSQQFNHHKLVVLRTDVSSLGFGYVLLQPSNNAASTQAWLDYRAGKGISFMTKESAAHLHPVCFGACKCQGNEVRLHSHLGKCFAGNYIINKMQHYVFGQQIVWVTDCYAVKFLLSYEGGNPASCVGTSKSYIVQTHILSRLITGCARALTSTLNPLLGLSAIHNGASKIARSTNRSTHAPGEYAILLSPTDSTSTTL